MTSITTPLEELTSLASSIKDIIVTKREETAYNLIHAKYLVGNVIVKNPLYKKWTKGSGDLIKRLSEMCGASQSDLYYCVQFVEKYPALDWDKVDVSTAVEPQLGIKWNWTNIKAALPAPKEECEHNFIEKEVIVIKEVCQKCGKTRKKE